MKTRIVVVAERMTGELIARVFASDSDTVIAGVLPRNVPLITVARKYAPHLLITSVTDEGLEELDALLRDRPRLTVLGISSDGRGSFLYRLRPQKEALGELSAATLVAAARAAVGSSP